MAYSWESELPALAMLSDQEAADAINDMIAVVVRLILSSEMMTWLAVGGRYQRLQNIADDVQASVELRSIAKVAILMLGRFDTTIDFTNPVHQALFVILQAANAVTGEEAGQLQAMATVTQKKYPLVYSGQIADVRRAQ